MFKKKFVVEIIFDNGAVCKTILRGKMKDIKKDLEYYKSKAYWYDINGNFMVMKTNQPV